MEGGAPAGIRSFAGPDGCLTMSTKIRIMTRQGKIRTAPSGMEILELPRSRTRRLKNANLEVARSFV